MIRKAIRKALFDLAAFAIVRLAEQSDARDIGMVPYTVKKAFRGMKKPAIAAMDSALGKRREVRMSARRLVQLDRGTGVTRNISTSGVFFVTDVDYVPGNKINFAIELRGFRGGKLMLRSWGKIVRIEIRRGIVGVGARILASKLETKIRFASATSVATLPD
jgi:hypothetical protein